MMTVQATSGRRLRDATCGLGPWTACWGTAASCNHASAQNSCCRLSTATAPFRMIHHHTIHALRDDVRVCPIVLCWPDNPRFQVTMMSLRSMACVAWVAVCESYLCSWHVLQYTAKLFECRNRFCVPRGRKQRRLFCSFNT